MASPTYTDEQKARALEIYHAEGPSVAASEIGCARQTIYNWLRESIDTEKTPEELATEALYQTALRYNIRRRLLEKVTDLLDRFDQPHIDYRGKDAHRVQWDAATSGDIRAYATSIGILIDKYRLEVGEATAHTYHEGTDDIDRRVAQLVDEIRRNDTAQTS